LPIPDDIRPLAQEWRNDLHSTHAWQQHGRAVPGEAGGFQVKCVNTGILGYLKPTRICLPSQPRPAHEKIAYDLAYELNLPVPPVLLYRRPEICDEKRACVSMFAYPEIFTWHQIQSALPGMSAADRKKIDDDMQASSGILAFDYYVGQTDRANPLNIVWGSDATKNISGFCFIDYSFSMNHDGAWSGDKWQTLVHLNLPAGFFDAGTVDITIVRNAVTAIESLPDDKIVEIVNRIDGDYLSGTYRRELLNGLLNRRALVRNVIRTRYPI
jgi:hypothetical protein